MSSIIVTGTRKSVAPEAELSGATLFLRESYSLVVTGFPTIVEENWMLPSLD